MYTIARRGISALTILDVNGWMELPALCTKHRHAKASEVDGYTTDYNFSADVTSQTRNFSRRAPDCATTAIGFSQVNQKAIVLLKYGAWLAASVRSVMLVNGNISRPKQWIQRRAPKHWNTQPNQSSLERRVQLDVSSHAVVLSDRYGR